MELSSIEKTTSKRKSKDKKKEPLLSAEDLASDAPSPAKFTANFDSAFPTDKGNNNSTALDAISKTSNNVTKRTGTSEGSAEGAAGGVVVLGTAFGGSPIIPEGSAENEEPFIGREKKKGHKFFFFCCDSKRAVIWLAMPMFMLNLMALTLGAVRGDPSMEGYVQAMVVRGCGMFVMFTTILGAWWYNKIIVLVGLLFVCYQLTMAIIGISKYDWQSDYNEDGKLEILLPLVWNVLLFYAEAVFISEVNDGIMSDETYKRREKYSCCCNC